jgi:hypothetical protein
MLREPHLPLTVRRDDNGDLSVKLDGTELNMLLAQDGLKIRSEAPFDGAPAELVVDLKFGHGSLELDLDVELLRSLLAEKEAADV